MTLVYALPVLEVRTSGDGAESDSALARRILFELTRSEIPSTDMSSVRPLLARTGYGPIVC